jgi:hypothetical protein
LIPDYFRSETACRAIPGPSRRRFSPSVRRSDGTESVTLSPFRRRMAEIGRLRQADARPASVRIPQMGDETPKAACFLFSGTEGIPMRHSETLPAWAARQRSRRLGRHSDDKVVRWINQGNSPKDDTVRESGASSNDNVISFGQGRPVPTH